ncbi:MAG: transcription factor S [Candidatus Aenigmatarchaeota archaeon]
MSSDWPTGILSSNLLCHAFLYIEIHHIATGHAGCCHSEYANKTAELFSVFGFCRCGGLLVPEKGGLRCRKCGAQQPPSGAGGIVKSVHESKGVAVIETDEPSLPTMEVDCPKCGNSACYFWVIQTRASDEPPTRFFRCTKCRYTWREYS